MNPRLRSKIRQRAGQRCEYCHLPESVAELRFQADHVLPAKHGGATTAENLCWACFRCNSHKGPNLTGLDETTGEMTRLFNPRLEEPLKHRAPLRALIFPFFSVHSVVLGASVVDCSKFRKK